MAKKGTSDRKVKTHKAGRTATPPVKGPHITDKETRARGKWLHRLGFSDNFSPIHVGRYRMGDD